MKNANRVRLSEMPVDNFLSSTVPIDLKPRDQSRYIACAVLRCGEDVALLDPGPSCTLDNLYRGLRALGVSVSDVTAVLLTHVHFDHAGVVGHLVAENPRIRVYVHARGSSHLSNPERLVKSASRVLGGDIEEFWGPFLPVPTQNMIVVNGGDTIGLRQRKFEVLYTPGHAVHHVSYFETETKTAFVGDAAGLRISGSAVYPATPPPDIDPQQMEADLDLIESRKPERFFLTHFGLVGDVAWHVSDFRQRLRHWSELVRLSLQIDADDLTRSQAFFTTIKAEMASVVSPEEAEWFENSISSRQNWYGLARYWRHHDSSHLNV